MPVQDITSPIPFAGGYVQSAVTTLGLNGSYTNVELRVVVDADGSAGTAQTFDQAGMQPGSISGLSVGSFDFIGIVQSWRKSYSAGGIVHNVKIVDPRVSFDNVHVVINGRGARLPTPENIQDGSGVYNVISAYDYYGNDYDAQYDQHGMSWNKIRPVLESSGYIKLYGNHFKLRFDDNFVAPDYYKVPAGVASLNQLLQNVAKDLSLDYYTHINTTGYRSGSVNTIDVVGIKRDSGTAGDSIDAFILANSGVLIAYERGQELSSYPTDGIVIGAPYTYMHSTANMMTSYGRAFDGRLLTVAGNSTDLSASYVGLTDPERYYGYVLLDNITSIDPVLISSLPTIDPMGRTVVRNNTYPARFTISELGTPLKGYRPTENVMRAALFSQEAWEALLFNEQSDVAASIGIAALVVRSKDDVALIIEAGETSPVLIEDDAEVWDRDAATEAVISAVYERTREYAERYYGRQFVAEMPPGEIYEGAGGSINFRYGYKVIDAVIDSNSPTSILTSGSSSFRTPDGHIRAYVKLAGARNPVEYVAMTQNPDGVTNAEADTVYYDFSQIDKESVIFDDEDAYIAINISQDETNLARALFEIPAEVNYKTTISLNKEVPASYVEFYRALGWTDENIASLAVPYVEEYAGILGLAPKRVTNFDRVYIPIQNDLNTYGPYTHVSDLSGGTYLNIDEAVSRETYGTLVDAAGEALVQQGVTDKTYIDSASFTLAGIPTQTLGDLIGDNAYITSLNIARDNNGLVTTYGLQSFAFPLVKLSSSLTTKINKAEARINKAENTLINLDNKIKEVLKERGPDYKNMQHDRKKTVYKTENWYLTNTNLGDWTEGNIHG